MSELTGQLVGKYQIAQRIGKGGMASVYRAVDVDTSRIVAVKILSLEHVEAGEDIWRFQREVKTISQVAHPHIVKVLDYGQQDDLLYLVMELLSGGNLAGLIHKTQSSMPLDTASKFFAQIASALSHAHQLGIIHRDLKPQNVLLDQEQNAYLADFGIAKFVRQSTAQITTGAGLTLGTPTYMAPEQWQNEPIDERTDIYALGILLFEILVGKPPFTSENPLGLMNRHIFEPPPSILTLRPEVPAGVSQVIDRALAKAPEQRFRSVAEMAAVLKSRMSGQHVVLTATPKIQLSLENIVDEDIPTGKVFMPSASTRLLSNTDASRENSETRQLSVSERTRLIWIWWIAQVLVYGAAWLICVVLFAGSVKLLVTNTLGTGSAFVWGIMLITLISGLMSLFLPIRAISRRKTRFVFRYIAFFLPSAILLIIYALIGRFTL